MFKFAEVVSIGECISGVKKGIFIDLLQIFGIEIPFGKSYIWNVLYRKCPTTRMGVPGICNCDVTKAAQ